MVSLYVRYRHALRAGREQIKWLAYAAAVLLTGSILLYAVQGLRSLLEKVSLLAASDDAHQ